MSPSSRTPGSSGKQRRRRTDVLSLVIGLMAIIYGSVLLFSQLVHPIDPELLGIAIPASLVVIGLIGLLAGGNRT